MGEDDLNKTPAVVPNHAAARVGPWQSMMSVNSIHGHTS